MGSLDGTTSFGTVSRFLITIGAGFELDSSNGSNEELE